ncbi:hypothetical protein ACSMXM_05625 [Pacificimonas sp. ICDLI1SI03]
MLADKQEFTIEPLGEHHLREAFCCGHDEIDAYVRTRALKEHIDYKVRVQVACPSETHEVKGFYSLAIGAIAPKSIAGKIKRKFGSRPIPMVYLAGVGTCEDVQKNGIGSTLMLDAFEKTMQIADVAGTACMALDAVNEDRARWYESLQFQRFGMTPDDKIRMFIPIATIRDALA